MIEILKLSDLTPICK